MIKCGKVRSLGGRPSKDGFINHIQLDIKGVGKIIVSNKLYRDINMGDIVSITTDDSDEYKVVKVFKNIRGSEDFKILKTNYKAIELCQKSQ